ncbi:MAG: DUF4271 domain-containing protein [Bacteroidota bacterium]
MIFYTLIGLLLLFAFLKTVFGKYVNDLFRLFFRRTLKQRQITEQLSQTPLPSLIFNAFFIITAGLYLSFILLHYGMGPKENFWRLTFYCSVGLGGMYLLKFLGLKFTGWVLNLTECNGFLHFHSVLSLIKLIGIYLLPFSYFIGIYTGWFVPGCHYFIVVRRRLPFHLQVILSYSAVHNQIRVKPFHFLVYLLALK